MSPSWQLRTFLHLSTIISQLPFFGKTRVRCNRSNFELIKRFTKADQLEFLISALCVIKANWPYEVNQLISFCCHHFIKLLLKLPLRAILGDTIIKNVAQNRAMLRIRPAFYFIFSVWVCKLNWIKIRSDMGRPSCCGLRGQLLAKAGSVWTLM